MSQETNFLWTVSKSKGETEHKKIMHYEDVITELLEMFSCL